MSLPQEQQRIAEAKLAQLSSSKFKQQDLPAWRPKKSFMTTIVSFVVFGLIFVVLGLVLIMKNKDAIEFGIRYDYDCQNKTNDNCEVVLEVKTPLKKPVMVYYEMSNFYQNHRTYVKNRSQKQLQGTYLSVDDISSDCSPIITNGDLELWQQANLNHAPLISTEPATPCGLIAKSYFNDEYRIIDPITGVELFNISDKGIAWDNDVEYKFKNIADQPDGRTYKDIQWVDMESERFIVWMRTAGLPKFKKLWGIIDEDIPAGNYTIHVNNRYDTSTFDGEKSFYLSNLDSFGQKSDFLSYVYIGFGSLLLVFGVIFFIFYKYEEKGNKVN